MAHHDIRVGTLANIDKGADYIRQILPHGFESFQIFVWQKIGDIDLKERAKQVLDVVGDKAVISSLGMFGNVLEDNNVVRDWERCIDNARAFNCDIVAGFSGCVTGKPIPESMPRFKQIWGELARRAEANGVRIAFENCDMGGWWHSAAWNAAHSPTAWEMMFNEVPSPNLGLEWEPCHQMVSLIDPIPQLRKWAARGKVFHVHGKDATIAWDVIKEYGIRGGKPYVWHRHPGFGDTDWRQIIDILRMNKFTGSIDIEGWHDPIYRDELEMTGQVHAMNYLKQCRGGPFVPNPK